MRHPHLRAWAALALLMAAASALATAPVGVVMGPSRDGSLHDLQRKVDRFIGPGRVDVRTDFIGARPGDPDPFVWLNPGTARTIQITLVDRKNPHGVLGWYEETGAVPAIDGVGDGVVFENVRLRGSKTTLRLPAAVARFGFYVQLQAGEDDEEDGPASIYFSNRLLNDVGPYGHGAHHEPYDGDIQMLVYDVSRWLGSNSWLVACEFSDSGSPVGLGRGESDNDFSDIVYLVAGPGAGSTTPTRKISFGHIKSLFR